MTPANAADRAHSAAYISSFNSALQAATTNFSTTHTPATVFFFDAHSLFSSVLDNPGSYQISSIIRNTTNECTSYNQ